VGCNFGDTGTALLGGDRELKDDDRDRLGVDAPCLEDVGMSIMGVSGNKVLLVEEVVEVMD